MPFWFMTHGWGWWWFPLHGLFNLVVLVLVIFVLASIFRGRHVPGMAGPARPTALQVLEERYAKGEIQRDEYLQKKQDLGG